MRKLLSIILLSTILLSTTISAVDAAKGSENGQPFQELQEQIDELNNKIDDSPSDSFFDIFFNMFEPDSFFDIFIHPVTGETIDSFFDIFVEIETFEEEKQDRQTQDAQLNSKIDSEISQRQAADSELAQQISEISTSNGMTCYNETVIKRSIPAFELTDGCSIDVEITSLELLSEPIFEQESSFKITVSNVGAVDLESVHLSVSYPGRIINYETLHDNLHCSLNSSTTFCVINNLEINESVEIELTTLNSFFPRNNDEIIASINQVFPPEMDGISGNNFITLPINITYP